MLTTEWYRRRDVGNQILFIDANTPEGNGTGLVRDSVVSGLVLVTVYSDTVAQVLGALSSTLKQKLDECLKAALALD